MKLKKFLFSPIDHSPVTLWRIVFGLVMVFECFGAILVGWTKQVFIDPPKFTFNFIGFEWLQPLSGNGMYVYFGLMGCLAIMVTLGYRYRFAMVILTIGWMGLYFMHKTSYNNHHYLMLLLSLMMTLTPANINLSLDAKYGIVKRQSTLPQIFKWQFLLLFLVVYVYASIAKWYPDWTSGIVSSNMLGHKKSIPIIGWIYSLKYTPIVVAWGGILYDLLVIPLLLWKPTRKFAFVISIGFHLFNSITFQIGTFPYMMIGASVLFFPPATLHKFFRLKPSDTSSTLEYTPKRKSLMTYGFALFFVWQILLPLRHFAIPGWVYWTEEGHKLSWRMMLRSKSGNIGFRILGADGKQIYHDVHGDLTKDQYRTMSTHPDMIWQYCQYLKTVYGNDIEIYVNSYVSLNMHKHQRLIDPNVDMAKAKWHRFKHEDWILPYDFDIQENE